jgi:hypothetical protein
MAIKYEGRETIYHGKISHLINSLCVVSEAPEHYPQKMPCQAHAMCVKPEYPEMKRIFGFFNHSHQF